ncbi:hypothetical protein [Pseudobacteriovorax antillogorgiicola]|uniref:Uncharacterized protein n=1 Tax=Pseudobacteriovorax antillogorgiicola TaxID=1513793 RepID=A0A1Y6BSG6_9BACT|nr:hypothetical protein [Pseudobacteriovorax antillogorgiicola]TCS53090.1 hypothetical protein EDD56_108141 [Pseudobacteriovorax antillogorgiicola]SMF26039.1 hypothetical protein SAMN06296036_108106 [Pseudobacteriovorax antillogorgiicola]
MKRYIRQETLETIARFMKLCFLEEEDQQGVARLVSVHNDHQEAQQALERRYQGFASEAHFEGSLREVLAYVAHREFDTRFSWPLLRVLSSQDVLEYYGLSAFLDLMPMQEFPLS